MIRLVGFVLVEMHEKWVTAKSSFTTKRYEADKEEARNAMQVICKPLNITDPLTAQSDTCRKLNVQ